MLGQGWLQPQPLWGSGQVAQPQGCARLPSQRARLTPPYQLTNATCRGQDISGAERGCQQERQDGIRARGTKRLLVLSGMAGFSPAILLQRRNLASADP